jgi:hypothetical protein
MINCIPGTTVSIIDPRSEVLGFIDRDVMQANSTGNLVYMFA